MNTTLNVDLCIVGAGSGGLSLAAGAVQMGASVVLVEGDKMGGDCLNYGCVPSKALLHAGRENMTWKAAHDHVNSSIATIAPHDSVERFEGLGVTVIQDWAHFISPNRLAAGDHIIKARRFVIATGSHAFIPSIKGLDQTPYHTNETIFSESTKPEHLIIIGAGPIGVEMAEAHRNLGCEVSLIEADRVLGRDDPELAEFVTSSLKKKGVNIIEHADITSVSGKKSINVELASHQTITGSHLLVAVGRIPNIARLTLDKAKVDTHAKGISVDDQLRTSNRKIYAIGDVASPLQFTHMAAYHASLVIRSILFALPARQRKDHIPRVTYTDPELAQIGLQESEAREKYGDKLVVLRLNFNGNDRAISTNKTNGLIKVMVHKSRPIGVSIVGPDAGEMINIWALAMANRLKMSQVAAMITPYPTMGELNKRIAGQYFTPQLFESPWIKRIVKLVQKVIP